MQRSIYLSPGDWIIPDLYHTRYKAVSAANCDHAPKSCFSLSSRQINPSMERADVRCGSKPEKLNESKCFPLFTQQRTSPRYFGMSVSCSQNRTYVLTATSV
jgi:hypothetical protein